MTRVFAFLFTSLFCVSSFAEKPGTIEISKESMVYYMATVCSSKTWDSFAEIAKKTNLFEKNFEVSNKIRFTKNEAIDEELGLKVLWDKNALKLTYNNKTYSGSDPCDLLTNFAFYKKNYSHLIDYVLKKAQAADLVKVPGWYKVFATGAVLLSVSVAASCLAGGITFCVIGAGTTGLTFVDSIHFISGFEAFYKNSFKLQCSNQAVNLENTDMKISIDKTKSNPIVKIFDKKRDVIVYGNAASSFASSVTETMREIFAEYLLTFTTELAKQCNNSADEERIQKDIDEQRKRVQSKFETVKNWVLGVKKLEPSKTNTNTSQ